jgi:hypothetical protein
MYQRSNHWTGFREICYWGFTKIDRASSYLVKISQHCQALCVKTWVFSIVCSDICTGTVQRTRYCSSMASLQNVLHCWQTHVYVSSTKVAHCCVCMAIVVVLPRSSETLYVRSPFRWIQRSSPAATTLSIEPHRRILIGRPRKIARATISFAMSVLPSVCPRGTTRLPLVGFS